MATFTYSTRIYYEDTDAAGVVYYANYLKFMERARTEAMHQLGFSQLKLANEGFVFVVSSCQIKYLAPAKLDDRITVNTTIKSMSATSIIFMQNISTTKDIVSGEIKVVCVDAESFKPRKIPTHIKEALQCQ